MLPKTHDREFKLDEPNQEPGILEPIATPQSTWNYTSGEYWCIMHSDGIFIISVLKLHYQNCDWKCLHKVQRNWMYLENIFIGSEDIRKQLPQESILFEDVHKTFMSSMKSLADASKVIVACSKPGMLETFNDMDAKLEKIQKSLENYLESKRQQFPRFYFLSSDDLLEILGQAKDPMNVQSHLKKCFEGISWRTPKDRLNIKLVAVPISIYLKRCVQYKQPTAIVANTIWTEECSITPQCCL